MSWTKVTSKRSDFRWDVFPFGGMNHRVVTAVVTSFYVSEFSDFFNAKRLYELFGCSGNVVEVAISPRRNSFGKRFAFARFLDVEDDRLLAIRLDNILIEGKKLHVNLPRFNRVQGVVPGRFNSFSSKGYGGRFNPGTGESSVKVASGGNKGVLGSYADVVAKGRVLGARKEGLAVLNFQSDKALKCRFEKAFVGRVCIPGSSYNIQNYLEMEGVFSIKVRPLGGNSCLLEELEDGFIGDLIKEGETWWKSLFSVIEKWEAGMMDGRRDAWFRIYGIPLHAWCPDFFVALGELWGRFLCIDDNTSKGEAFDVARILVNIPLSLCLPDVVPVRIDGVTFNLCIREDAQSLYRQVGGNQKALSSEGDTSDSDFERLMVESDSSCSDEPEGREVKEGVNSDEVNEKAEVLPDIHGVRHSGDIPEAGIRGKLAASSGADSEGNRIRLVCSDSRSGSVVKHSEEESICKDHAEPEVGAANILDIKSRIVIPRSGQLDLKGGYESASSGECALVCSDDFSESEANLKQVNSSSLISDVCEESSIRNSDIGSQKDISSGFGPDVGSPYKFNTDVIVGSSKANLSKASMVRLRSDHFRDFEEVTDRCSTRDSVSVSSHVGGLSKAVLDKISVDAGNLSLSSIGDFVNYTVGNIGPIGEGTDVLKYKAVCDSNIKLGEDFQNGARGGGKIIRKDFLSCDQNCGGKGRLKAKSYVGRNSKGALPTVHHRGSSSTCYGEQSEESDIQRNNGRQWDILKREVGERLWEAMTALGVVDCEGRNSKFQGTEPVLGGRKEKTKLLQ